MTPQSAHPLVVGLSSGVLGTVHGPAQLDGIGIYTSEVGRRVAEFGVSVRRIAAPIRSGLRLSQPASADARFLLPLTWLAGMSAICRTYTPGAKRVLGGIDVYHATDLVIPRLRDIPVVATVYDAIPLSNPQWVNPRLRRIKNQLLRTWVASASMVIAISNAAVPELIEHFLLPPDRIRVVPLGVDDTWFIEPGQGELDRELARHGLAPGYFLHVGTLQPRKDLDRLVDAYERLPAAIRARRQLVLVGRYGWGVDELRARLTRLRGAGRVVWLGYLPRRELLVLYRAAGAFVFPSLAEGFGLPVLEAMAAGSPIVASDIPALREISGGHADFVTPGNTDALIDALTRADAREDCASLQAARRTFARRYDWGRTAARTIDVYRELVPAKSAPASPPAPTPL